MDEKEIFKNIKIIRQNKKMPLERLAKLTGLTKGYVSKIENSDKAPPFSTLIKFANALNTDISLLIAEDSEIPENINLCISIIPHSCRSLGGKKRRFWLSCTPINADHLRFPICKRRCSEGMEKDDIEMEKKNEREDCF